MHRPAKAQPIISPEFHAVSRERTMQSSLPRKWGATLQPLAPIVVRPTSTFERVDALLALHKIQAVCVSSCGKDGYDIEVHLKTSCALDTPNNTRSDNQDDNPQQSSRIQLQKQLWEFIDLRDNVYNIVQSAHNGRSCKFCWKLLDLLMERGVDPGGILLALLGNARAARKLTKFVTDLLAYIQEHSAVEVRDVCTAQTLVPQVVNEFLSIPTSTTEATFVGTDTTCQL